VPAEPVTALRAQHDARGLRVDARTTCATEFGARLNLVWAIDVLHPLARQPSIVVPTAALDPIDEEMLEA
jgi:hypothetical protein